MGRTDEELCRACGAPEPALRGGGMAGVFSTMEPLPLAHALGAKGWACSACGEPLPVEPTIAVVDSHIRRCIIALGTRAADYPKEELARELREGLPIEHIEFVGGRGECRTRLAEWFRDELALLKDATAAHARDELDAWMSDHHEKMTAQTFAVAWLACLVAIPGVHVVAVRQKEGAPQATVQTVLKQVGRLQVRTWIAALMRERLPDVASLDEDLERMFAKGAVLPGATELLVEIIEGTREHTNPAQDYALRAAIGVLGTLGEPVGALVNEWPAVYLALELAFEDPEIAEALARLRVSDRVARATVDQRAFFDAATRRVNADRDGRQLEAIFRAAERIGFDDFARMLMQSLQVRIGDSEEPEVADRVRHLLGKLGWSLIILTYAERLIERLPRPARASAALEVAEIVLDGRTDLERLEIEKWLGKVLYGCDAHEAFLERVGVTPRSFELALSAFERAGLDFERAKALRRSGRHAEAEALLVELEARDHEKTYTSQMTAVLLLERARIQRERGDLEGAAETLKRLGEPETVEERIIYLSNSANLDTSRFEWTPALEKLDRAAALAVGAYAHHAPKIAAQRLQTLSAIGDDKRTLAELEKLPVETIERSDVAFALLAVFANLLAENEAQAPPVHFDAALRRVQAILDDDAAAPADVHHAAAMLGILADLAGMDSSPMWALADAASREAGLGDDPNAILRRAALRLEAADLTESRELLTAGHAALCARFSGVQRVGAMAGSTLHLLGTRRMLERAAGKTTPEMSRVVAEIGRDIIGRARSGNPGPLPWDDVIAAVLPRSTAVLDFWSIGANILCVVTSLDAQGAVKSDFLDAPGIDLDSLAVRLRSRLDAWHAGRRGDPFDLPEWLTFTSWLQTSLAGALENIGEIVVIQHDETAQLPWHVAIGDGYRSRYVPSWSVLLSGSAIPAPRSVAFITVPRRGENTALIDAMDTFRARVASAVERHGAQVQVISGADADRTAMSNVLQTSDLVIILCHGLVELGTRTTAWLIANDGALPLMDSVANCQELGRQHRFGWGECEELERAPAIVISAACSSGRAHFTPGNEVLGLYSVLRSIGTKAFVAPQWDIEPAASLPVLADALEQWFTGKPLQEAIRAASGAASNVSKRHAWAFAIEGG